MLPSQKLFEENCTANASNNPNLKYTFIVDWFDPLAQIVKKFLMSYYANDQTVELYDLKNHRSFLRRCKQEGIQLENLYKTAIVTIMSRQMKVIDYADGYTKQKFELELSQTFCMVKPDLAPRVGEIITFLQVHGFKIIKMKMGRMTSEFATEFYEEHKGQKYLPGLLAFMVSGPAIGMSVIGENAVNRLKDFIGPMDSEKAKIEAPRTLRAIYGTDITKNGVHGSKDEKHVAWETDGWFSKNSSGGPSDYILPTCILSNTTCCIVKPHAVLEGTLGPILNYINENGFSITAMEMFNLDVPTAEEFLEVYKGVVPEYSAMVVQLTSGNSVAIEVMDTNNPELSQENFRKLCGPNDPEIAQKLRPDTIRAKFGRTKVMNAVHCTDLPDDATLEVEYFFKVLQI